MEIPGLIWDAVKEKWLEILPGLAAKMLAGLAAKFGGPVGWVLSIYDLVKWIWQKIGELRELWEAARGAFSDAIGAAKGAAASIATKVVGFAKTGLALTASAIASLLKIDSLPKKLKELIEAAKEKAQQPLKALLRALAMPIESLLKAVGLRANDNVVGDPISFNDQSSPHKLWLSTKGNSAYAWVASGERQLVRDRLERWKKCAKGDEELLAKITQAEAGM